MADLIITVKVKTKSGKFNIQYDNKSDNYIAYLKSVPENNKANIELIKELSRLTHKDVSIISGFKSKIKVIRVDDFTLSDFNELIRKI